MKTDEVKAALARAVRREWPNVTKASDLPYPDYWKSATEWLCFHAPHIGDRLMERLVADVVREAVLAEAAGTKPKPYKVPDKVRQIWEKAEHAMAKVSLNHVVPRGPTMETRPAPTARPATKPAAMTQGRLI